MATNRQIQANRLNAQRSTGPKTPEGKTASSRNALKTGIDAKSQIIRGESAAALQALADEYHSRWQPATPEERFLLDTLIDCEWLLRRLRRLEAEIWEYEIQEAYHPDPDHPLGQAFRSYKEIFNRLQRRIDSTQRNYHRALTELRRLQAGCRPATPPETIDSQPTSPKLASFRQRPVPFPLTPANPPEPPAPEPRPGPES